MQQLTDTDEAQDTTAEEPVVSNDDDGDDGDNNVPVDTKKDPSPDKRKHRWLWALLAAALAAVPVLYLTGIWQPFGSDSNNEIVTGAEGVVATGEDFGPCQADMSVNLDEVGVLRYGDSLQYNEINPFWLADATANGDASAVLENAVTELFHTVGDGCTSAGAAYWRNVLSHVIDADRLGVDNHDASARIAVYKEEMDTQVAVSTETARQLSACADVQFVNLTVEDAPRIYVAAYTPDYNDVVFVQTPLLQLDNLSSGDKGLVVIRCSFGKVEGNNGDYVNETLISPSLRAIVYLDRPTGVQVFKVIPDTMDREGQTQNPQEQQEQQATEEEAQTPEAQTTDDVDDTDQTRDVTPTLADEAEEMPVEQTDTPQTSKETPEPSKAQTSKEEPAVQQPTDEQVGEQTDVTQPETSTTQTPETSETTEATEETEPTTDQETDTAQQPEEDTPAQTPETTETTDQETDDGAGTVTQPEQQEECPDGCNPVDSTGDQGDQMTDEGSITTDDGTGGTDDVSGGSDDGTGTNGGGDCPNGDCPGDGDGDDGTGTNGDGDCPNGDCPGDGDGDDGTGTNGDGDCPNGDCPGDGDGDDGTGTNGDGDCPNGDCPGDEQPQPACPTDWIIDPFGNCKEPDPGPGGF